MEEWICGANFSHLQPMAELRRKQRSEIRRQHVKAHSCIHFSPCFDHTLPTQTDDGTSQIDHDIGTYVPYPFQTLLRVLLRPLPTEVQGWRRQGQRLNVTAQWRDHLNWERVSQLAWSHQFFKELGWWSDRGLNSRPPAQQTGALPTELTGQRRLEGAVTLWISASTHQLMDCIFSLH